MEENTSYPIGKTLRRLLENLVRQDKSIIHYFIIFTVSASIYPFFAVILPRLLLDELGLGDAASVENIIIIAAGYLFIAGIFGFMRTFTKDFAYPKLSKLRIDYIRDMFDKLVSMDYKYHEDASFLEENERALQATSSNDNGVEGVYHKLFETPAVFITILALVVFIAILNPLMLIGLGLNLYASLWINKKVHTYQYGLKKELAHAERRNSYYYKTTHDFAYGKDIRIYGLKHRILSNFTKEIDAYVKIHKLIKDREYKLGFLGLFTLLISELLVYGILINRTIQGMSIANFSMYLVAIMSLSQLLKTFAEDLSIIKNEGHYVYDFFEFMDADHGEKGGNLPRIEDDALEIEFKNVSFKYPKTDNYIIKNLDFKINKGERLAIVGINGAGKTSLVKLMTGLFDVTEGEILINSIPIKDFDKKELFSMFSVVFQDVNILAYSIKENVSCSLDKMDEDRVITALNKVGLYNKVKDFEKGLDQMMLKVIDAEGTEFSGGESQKLAIARALYKDGNMVIMDEPTAALDALAEAEIYENFDDLVSGKTAVYISHRLASTKFCDKIALFDNDGLREYGNHKELMEKQGQYYKMFTIQGKYYNEGGVLDEQLEEA